MTAPHYFVLAAVAFGVSYLATGRLVTVLRHHKILDIPNRRSSHASITPRGGGLGILLGLLVGILLAHLFGIQMLAWPVLITLLLTAGVGFADDLFGISALLRLAVQAIAAGLIVYSFGGLERFPLPTPFDIALGPFAEFAAVIWIVGVVNIYNFLDGIDGYAGVQAVIAGLAFALALVDPVTTVAGVVVAASAGGFLLHNWHPARVFMGDVGSTVLGLYFAVLPFQAASPSNRHHLVFLTAMFLWFFLSDGAHTILRRIRRREKLWRPHRSHLYQRLIQTGLKHDDVVLWISAASLSVAGFAVTGWHYNSTPTAWGVLVAAILGFLLLWQSTLICERLSLLSKASDAVRGSVRNRSERPDSRSGWVQFIRGHRRLALAVFHAVLIAVSFVAAFWLRFEFDLPAREFPRVARGLVVAIVTKSIVFRLIGMNHSWSRFAGILEGAHVFLANVAASAVMVSVWPIAVQGASLSVSVIDFMLCFILTTAARFAFHVYHQVKPASIGNAPGEGVLLWGTGTTALNLAREIASAQNGAYRLVGVVTNDKEALGDLPIGAAAVYSQADLPAQLERIRESGGVVDHAIVVARGQELREALDTCRSFGIDCKTITQGRTLDPDKRLVGQVRDITLGDLLGNRTAAENNAPARKMIGGRSVLVTGAGGSIGSELCRQIAGLGPRVLVAFDHAEFSLVRIFAELRKEFTELDVLAEPGDIRDTGAIEAILNKHDIALVFNSAAYCDNRNMEAHPIEACKNNIIGTLALVQAVDRTQVSLFVQVSSVSAAHPSTVRDATNCVMEDIVTTVPNGPGRFLSVRIGDSVEKAVSLIEEQIEAGGPAAIADAGIGHGLLTVEESVQLILRASAMGKNTGVYVVDPGKDTNAVDLVRSAIQLRGKIPHQNIRIYCCENGSDGPTPEEDRHSLVRSGLHPWLSVLTRDRDFSREELLARLRDLERMLAERNEPGVRRSLIQLVPGYCGDRIGMSTAATDARVSAAEA